MVASEVNGIATLRAFVWDSIRVCTQSQIKVDPTLIKAPLQYSSLTDQEKEEAYDKLERRWTKFIRYIIDQHGGSSA